MRPDLPGDLGRGTLRDIVLWPDPRLRLRAEPAGYMTGPEPVSYTHLTLPTTPYV